MRFLSKLVLATLIALGCFFALAGPASQFRHDLVAVAAPIPRGEPPMIAPAPDAGAEVAQLACR
ncbi:MAG TPA: hypothetical protein VFF06_26135 [Polyangia bacterium]|nr:hypothetical protein [Polyangia bacterium]